MTDINAQAEAFVKAREAMAEYLMVSGVLEDDAYEQVEKYLAPKLDDIAQEFAVDLPMQTITVDMAGRRTWATQG